MARPLRIEYPGAHYHVTARGNEQKNIFKSQKDRERFLSYLKSSVQRYGAVIHTYCLMSNHYHLLLETPDGNLSQIMRHINGAYTTYFNAKRQRAGHLFQGRYKAILVQADEYAQELSRYIHLNPVKAGIAVRPEDFPWSSYPCFIGATKAPDWLTTNFILKYFGQRAPDARKSYRKFVEEGLDREDLSPLEKTVASTILGNADFMNEITQKYLGAKQVDRNVPALQALAPRPSLDAIMKIVTSLVGDDAKLSQKVGIYLCHRYSGARLKEIGGRFNIGESAVSQTSRRVTAKMESDKDFKKLVEKMEGALRMLKM